MLLVLTAAKSTILDEPEVPGKIKLPLIWVLDVGPSRKAEADEGSEFLGSLGWET